MFLNSYYVLNEENGSFLGSNQHFIFCLKVFISFYSQIIPDDRHDSVQKRLFRTLNENSCYA